MRMTHHYLRLVLFVVHKHVVFTDFQIETVRSDLQMWTRGQAAFDLTWYLTFVRGGLMRKGAVSQGDL